jgi:metacaspase-1
MDMADIVKSNKFKVKTLLTKAATRKTIQSELSKAAKALKPDDIFMLNYSGHGGQLPDIYSEEADAMDETWCLYDGKLIDDELYEMFGKFKQGVRVLVFSDSCHSGTVVKMAYYQGTMQARSSNVGSQQTRYRFMPPDIALRTYRNNRKFYDSLMKDPKLRGTAGKVKASVLLISGCQDNQYSADGDFNCLFTANLLRIWNNGKFKRGYRAFHKAIVKRMPPDQTPNYFTIGAYNPQFEGQIPFTV